MDDGESLIRRMRENRDDDAPRLAYADWLDRHGNSDRAEFIRLQCWLAARLESDPDWEASWYREQELLQAHGARWEAELANYSEGATEFDRGFPSWFYAHDVGEFGHVLGELSRLTATDRLKVCRTGDEDVNAYGSDWMEMIRELETNTDVRGLTEDGLTRLVHTPQLRHLLRLDLSGAYFVGGNPDAEILARSPVLPSLRHLHLGLSFPADVGRLVGLLESPHRRHLRGLEVKYLHEADVIELCRCPGLAKLTHLDIGWCTPTDAGGLALAECPHLDRIEVLNFSGAGELNAAGEAVCPLVPAVQEQLRRRFSHRVVLDPEVNGRNSIGRSYRSRVTTGRSV